MTNTPGFYKFDGRMLYFAPNSVYAPNFTLLLEQQATYTYPVDGWYYFDTTQQAESFFEINGQSQTNWTAYREGLLDPRYMSIVAAASTSTPKAALAALTIAAALSDFENQGRHNDYLKCILYILEGSTLPVAEKTELAAELLALMTQCNLPGQFITELVEALDSLSSP